jgi:serine/threonine protein kinase
MSSTAISPSLTRLEYTSPESLPSPQTGLLLQIDSKADMWSLGMILHKILFFRLPYHYASDDAEEDGSAGDGIGDGEKMARLEQEIQSYSGLVLFLYPLFATIRRQRLTPLILGSSLHRRWSQRLKLVASHVLISSYSRAF